MQPTAGRWWCRRALALLLALVTGCGLLRPPMDQTLLARKVSSEAPVILSEQYAVAFPDVLDVRTEGRPAWGGALPVRIDGTVDLGPGGGLHVEGKAPAEIARLIAVAAGVAPAQVQVTVAEHRSQHLFVYGEVKGVPRAVPYRGPETVLDLLRRAGGITPGAAPRDIQVVRAHVADGGPPEVFEVDLEAILLNNDQKTNVRLQPFDQIYIGETKTSSLRTCFPPWLRPLYETLCGLHRPGPGRPAPPPPPPRLLLRANQPDAIAAHPSQAALK